MNFLVNAILVLRTNMQPELEFFQWISDQNIPERGLRKAALIPLWSIGFVTVVPSLSGISLSANPWTTARQALPSFTIFQSLCKLMSIESVMSSTISFSAIPFSSCPQSFPASGFFPVSQLFTSGGQNMATMRIKASFPTLSQLFWPYNKLFLSLVVLHSNCHLSSLLVSLNQEFGRERVQ